MRENMITISNRLDTNSHPYKLFQKSKKLGTWDPKDIDFTQDVNDWRNLSEIDKSEILRLVSQFLGGEEAVTIDLLPLIMIIAKEERLEEELFLTSFLFEEAKHTEFFNIFLNNIEHTQDLSIYHSESYKELFYKILPDSMNKLKYDESKQAIAEASTVYNMFSEGVIAETGYFAFANSLKKNGIMPGLMKGIELLKQDESRHISYGTYLLHRLISEDSSLFKVIEDKMNSLAPLALKILKEGVNKEISNLAPPFKETIRFTKRQISIRLKVIERVKYNKIEDIYK